MKRLFIAIKLIPDDNLLKTYYALKHATRYDKINWVDPDNFHLTLKFLGNTPEDKIDLICDVINSTVESHYKFKFDINKTGIFGSKYKPRVIWFGIDKQEQLKNLGMEIINNLDIAGFSKDRQNFVPHFTIGRIRKILNKQLLNIEIEKIKEMFLQKVLVDKIILYESILISKSPTYEVIDSFQLKD
jgi:2'-5' RNA ligase